MSMIPLYKRLSNVFGGQRVCSAGRRAYANKLEMFRKRLDAEEVGRKLELSDDVLSDVTRAMSEAMNAGLRSPADPSAANKCLDTRIDFPPVAAAVARSTAVGRYLGVDLTGGVRFRTQLAAVSDTNDVLFRSRTFPVPDRVKTGSGRQLFDVVADGLAEFAGEHGVRAAGLPLAFTFGFPVRQTALGSAALRRWTKGYDCADSVGRNVAAELRASLARHGVDVGPVAVLNDACATMLYSLSDTPATRVGLVVDDGCNCCYAEPAANVRSHRKSASTAAHTVVNTEWGAFGENGALDHIMSKYDQSLDARSRHPRTQTFEKMTSGMYVAELVREMVLELTANKVLFDGHVTPAMLTQYSLKPAHLAFVESDARQRYASGRAVLIRVLGVPNPTDFDCELFRYACECGTRRSAYLVAAGLAAVLGRLKPCAPTVVVAVSGSMFGGHPAYAYAVGLKTKLLTSNLIPFTLRMVGPESGAPLVAGMLAGMAKTPRTR